MSEYLKSFVGFDKMPFYITLAGVTYPNPTYHITRICSNVSVIEYITDGDGYVVIDDKIHHVRKNMIYFLPSGQNHNYYSDRKNPFQKIFLNVSGDFCQHLIFAYGLSGKHFFDAYDLKPVFERIVSIISSDMTDSEMQSVLQGLFVEILSKLSTVITKATYSAEALKLKNYLDSNFHRIISAKELSKIIFRSPDYCQKLFIREFNITPYAYQIERKMQTAKLLLVNTNMSITEIAEKLGYNDIHYFSNLFQKKCGYRPSSYRKASKNYNIL